MRKLLYLSGALTILLLILLLTGWAYTDDTAKEAMRHGNQQFELADYNKALMAYEAGLSANVENKPLNFNAAQTAYLLGEYDKAIEYFEKSGEAIEKYLIVGNICYRSGDAVQDINQKAELYARALQFYQEGIIKYPQDISLKYNYEFVKEKLDEFLENTEQENSEQGEEGEESENQENQEQESSNGENSQGEQEQESENSENSQDSQEQDSEQNEENGENQGQSQEDDGEQEEAYSQDEGENAADQEAVERILQMLENQEEQSLKNNQEVVGGNEGKNGW